MSYIGNTSTTQAFTPAIDYFSGNGSTTAFTLSRPVASVAQVQVVIDNVAQNPSSAYTVSGSTITFTSAPLSGTNNIYVYYTSPITQVIAPGQGTVNTTALGNITNIASGNSSLTLQTGSGNTTAVTVDTSQNVGIGVTPSAWGSFKAIQLGGSTYNAIASSNSYMAIFGNTYYDGSNFKYVSTAGASTYIQSGGGHYLSSASSGTAGNTVTLTQVLAVGKSSTLALEGATTQTGTGITFPATQSASSDANTLDDYEEGTWTPVVTSQSGSITSYTATGSYTKVGRIVTIYSNIQVTNIGTASGQMFINGSPFSPLGGAQCGGVCRETTATGNIYTPMAYSSTFSIQNSTNGGVAWGTNYRYESINTYQN